MLGTDDAESGWFERRSHPPDDSRASNSPATGRSTGIGRAASVAYDGAIRAFGRAAGLGHGVGRAAWAVPGTDGASRAGHCAGGCVGAGSAADLAGCRPARGANE